MRILIQPWFFFCISVAKGLEPHKTKEYDETISKEYSILQTWERDPPDPALPT